MDSIKPITTVKSVFLTEPPRTVESLQKEEMSLDEIKQWLNDNLGQTNQATFIPKIIRFAEELIEDMCSIHAMKRNPTSNDEFYITFDVTALFSKRILNCGTSFAEFYLSDENGKCVYSESAYTHDEKAFKLLKAFASDYFNEHGSLHRTITKEDGSKAHSRHYTLIDAMSSHIIATSFSMQSLDAMTIKSEKSQITLEYFKEAPYHPAKIKIVAKNLNRTRQILLQELVDYFDKGKEKLIDLEFQMETVTTL